MKGTMMSVSQPREEPARPKVTWKSETRVEPQPWSSVDFAGERGIGASDLNPLVAFRTSAWQAMWDHARSAPVEVGGVLIGQVFADAERDQLLVDVEAAIPARGALESGAYFKLTDSAWDHISRERERRLPAATFPTHLIVGWYHTHPGLGVFYSGTDKASQKAFFAQPWNFGIVIDPVRDQYGVFHSGHSRRLPPEHLATYRDPVPPPPRELVRQPRHPGTREHGAVVRERDERREQWVAAALVGATLTVLGIEVVRRLRGARGSAETIIGRDARSPQRRR
jgi:proteasome lid subunit RPN8/RPN11